MVSRKAQSSIEYLTTYGWMLLAVSVAASTTYTAVDTSCQTSTTGFYSDSLQVQNFGLSRNETIIMSFQSDTYEQVEITNFTLDPEYSEPRSRKISTVIESGETGVIGLPGYETFEGCQVIDTQIEFDRGPLEGQKLSGEIEAPIQKGDLPVPEPPSNLTVDVGT